MADPFIGQISIFGFDFAPRGWALCNGQIIDISEHEALFALLGNAYGGNGNSNFGLPDLRCRLPVGMGQQPLFNSFFQISETGGRQTHNLMIDELPAHTPSVTVGIATDDANSSEPSDGCHLATVVSGGGGFDKDEKIYFDGEPSQMVPLGGVSSGATGKGIPINILNPYIALNFSIALEGAFPPRN